MSLPQYMMSLPRYMMSLPRYMMSLPRYMMSLPRYMMSDLLFWWILSVFTCWFHNTVNLHSRLVAAGFGTCSYHCWSSSFASTFLRTLKCVWEHRPSCIFMNISFVFIEHADTMLSIFSSYCWKSACVLLLLLLLLLLLMINLNGNALNRFSCPFVPSSRSCLIFLFTNYMTHENSTV
jgi:hypothetical protein